MTGQMDVETESDSKWKGLFRGIDAIVGGVLTLLDIMVFVVWPRPATIESWLALFQRNPVIARALAGFESKQCLVTIEYAERPCF